MKMSSPVNFAVLTVLRAELQAVQRLFGIDNTRDRIPFDGDLYWYKQLVDSGGHTRGVLVHCQGFAQNVPAAIAATKIIERYHPSLLVLCGIAAGRRGKSKIGDVVTPRSLIDYTGGVAVPGEVKPRILAPPLPHVVMQCMQSFDFDPSIWHQTIGKNFTLPIQPPVGSTPERIKEYQDHVASYPELREATIASGDLLLRDKDFLEKLSDRYHEHIRAGEMEAAGFARSCESRYPPVPWLVVRGISDFGDEFKDDRFHSYAATAAASYVEYFLSRGADFDLLNAEVNSIAPRSEPSSDQSPDCLNRDQIVDDVFNLLRDGSRIVALVGAPGVGKSTIARRIAKQARDNGTEWGNRFEKVVWVSAQPNWLTPAGVRKNIRQAATSSDVFHEIARAFNIPETSKQPLREQCETLIQRLETPTLVILDSYEHLEIDDFLYAFLDDLPSASRVLITSSIEERCHSNCVLRRVEEFTHDESIEFLGALRKRVDAAQDRDGDEEIFERVGGLPIALEWVIGQIGAGNMREVLSEIEDASGTVCEFLFKRRIRPRLTQLEWEILSAVALFTSSAPEPALSAMLGRSTHLIGQALTGLRRYFLISLRDSRVIMHGLTKKFVFEDLKSAGVDFDVQAEAFIAWAVHRTEDSDRWELDSNIYKQLSVELENLRNALELSLERNSDSEDRVQVLARAVVLILHIQGRWDRSIELAQQLCESFPDGLIGQDMAIFLGRHYAHRGQVSEALATLEPVIQKARRTGDNKRLAKALMRKGHAFTHSDLEAARQTLNEANQIAIELGEQRTQLSVIGYLADVLIQQEKFDEAIELLQKKPLEVAVRWDRADAYLACLMGDAISAKGDLTSAKPWYEKAKIISIEWADQRLFTWSLLGIAICEQNQAHAEQAQANYELLGLERESRRAERVLKSLRNVD